MTKPLLRKSTSAMLPKGVREVERVDENGQIIFHVYGNSHIVWIIIERKDGTVVELDPQQVDMSGYTALLQEIS
jgi:hypothetical protein